MSISILKRYFKYSRQLEKEEKHFHNWLQVLPVGQHPPSYDRALLKHAMSYERKLTPLWEKIRGRIDITKSGKTLWQHFPIQEHPLFPPIYPQIEPLLKPSIQRQIRPQIQTILSNKAPQKHRKRKR